MLCAAEGTSKSKRHRSAWFFCKHRKKVSYKPLWVFSGKRTVFTVSSYLHACHTYKIVKQGHTQHIQKEMHLFLNYMCNIPLLFPGIHVCRYWTWWVWVAGSLLSWRHVSGRGIYFTNNITLSNLKIVITMVILKHLYWNFCIKLFIWKLKYLTITSEWPI